MERAYIYPHIVQKYTLIYIYTLELCTYRHGVLPVNCTIHVYHNTRMLRRRVYCIYNTQIVFQCDCCKLFRQKLAVDSHKRRIIIILYYILHVYYMIIYDVLLYIMVRAPRDIFSYVFSYLIVY